MMNELNKCARLRCQIKTLQAGLKEKQLEINEVDLLNAELLERFQLSEVDLDKADLRCAELESNHNQLFNDFIKTQAELDDLKNVVQVAEAGIILINKYAHLVTLDEIIKDLNNAIKLGGIVK